jgi:DNA ligase 1
VRAFADLYTRLDGTTSSNSKLVFLQDYFRSATPADAAWAVYFLAGGRPRRLVPTKLLRTLALQTSGLPEWLFEECYEAVGDLAETITLLLPQTAQASTDGLAQWVEDRLLPLGSAAPDQVVAKLSPLLLQLDRASQLVFIKLITGSFRVGVSRLLVTRALAGLSGIDAKRIAQRMVGYTDILARPTGALYERLIAATGDELQDARDPGQPYPFFLAHSLQIELAAFDVQLGMPSQWQVEWKWDGIRAQLVKRDGQIWIWSRGEELVTERFPELATLASHVPDGTVLDGEIVVWKDFQVQPFALLQQRIGRKTLGPKLLAQVPVAMLCYDLLEWQGDDIRQRPQLERRERLVELVAHISSLAQFAHPNLQISALLQGDTWADFALHRAQARGLGVEGLMLKNVSAQYGVGRTKDVGVWWKWKVDPYTVDAVLIYAQAGHGRRASLYTDFTFAVWDAPDGVADRKLVPFAKAYSGLTDVQMRQVDAIIRKTTIDKFGPVRSVTPTMVFELGFEGISLSTRHKSGIAVRFPRILRWRQDKPLNEADTLASLRALLPIGTIV